MRHSGGCPRVLNSLNKAGVDFLVFFERPIAGTLGALCLLIWRWPLVQMLRQRTLAP